MDINAEKVKKHRNTAPKRSNESNQQNPLEMSIMILA